MPQVPAQLTIRQWVEKTFGPGPYTAEQQATLQRAHKAALAHGLRQETRQYFAFMEAIFDG